MGIAENPNERRNVSAAVFLGTLIGHTHRIIINWLPPPASFGFLSGGLTGGPVWCYVGWVNPHNNNNNNNNVCTAA